MLSLEVEQELSVFCKTTDNWAPSYLIQQLEVDAVEVRLLISISDDDPEEIESYCICVSGNDDCDMIKDYSCYREALYDFWYICSLADVTMSALFKIGFE